MPNKRISVAASPRRRASIPNRMETDKIKQRAAAIRVAAKAGDYEKAHMLEDALRKNVLLHIRDGHHDCFADIREKAALALDTSRIKFVRCCG